MNKILVISFASSLLVLAFGINSFANDIIWQGIGREHTDLRAVLVNSKDPSIIYIASDKGIFKTEDGGASWRNIFSIKGQNRTVNLLLFDPGDNNSLYAATGNGLFLSSDQGNNWNKIFLGKNYLEKECTSMAVLSGNIYLGTRAGLFVSKNKGRNWHKERGITGNSHILAIACSLKETNFIYVACVNGLFRTKDAGGSWERIFAAHPVETENGNNEAEKTEDTDEEGRVSHIRYVSIDPNDLNRLYLATSRGVYKSQDRGENWEFLDSFGLLNTDVRFLLIHDSSSVYAITKSGVFQYRGQQWQELSYNLTAGDIRFLATDRQNNLYVACEKGLFKARAPYLNNEGRVNIVSLYSQNEPKINEVQQAAIKYAEVGAQKIRQWRKQAKMKAILPKLTVGLDKSESTNYEIYTSATNRYIYEGPHDKSNGYDVTLSWELGDLIWNEAQASIDVRSRLMVQLRQDILDEVTKLYFERIRVKSELNNLTIEDSKKRFEKELKIQELTAMLDAFTGGYFSRQTPHY